MGEKKNWEHFRAPLRTNTYPLGDAYQDVKRHDVLASLKGKNKSWELEGSALDSYPYLKYVQQLVGRWPQLQLLADFMQVGTVPDRWGWFPGEAKDSDRYVYNLTKRKEDRDERTARTNVALLEYSDAGLLGLTRYQSGESLGGLKEKLNGLKRAVEDPPGQRSDNLSLLVVEDLSRDVIEALGYGLDIDPLFFRAHLMDYVWNNIRDPWREPRMPRSVARDRDWCQIRFVRSRYFPSEASLKKSFKEADGFNVQRRVNFDENESFWDRDSPPAQTRSYKVKGVEGKVGLIRSRASLWVKSLANNCTVGVLLLDPTIKEGYPLWRDYFNWEPPEPVAKREYGPPSMRRNDAKDGDTPRETAYKSWFEDFVYWAQRPSGLEAVVQAPAHVLLRVVLAEWQTMTDYINTRLNQINWEIEHPSYFGTGNRQHALQKLHIWRRWVPICREMLSETLQQGLRFRPWQTKGRKNIHCVVRRHKADFQLALDSMQEYQGRIDSLTSVVTAIISIEDAERNMRDSKNVRNLTMLATIFIPPTFFATLFSMTDKSLAALQEAFKWWATASAPSVVLLFITFWVLQKPTEFTPRRFIRRFVPRESREENRENHAADPRLGRNILGRGIFGGRMQDSGDMQEMRSLPPRDGSNEV